MSLDNLTTAQGRTYVTIKTKCCVHIPGNSANVLFTLKKTLHSQIITTSDSALRFNDLLMSLFSGTNH